MAEYIDIDAPIDVAVYQRNRRIQVTLRQILESNDAKYERADVVPVVRCGECKWSDNYGLDLMCQKHSGITKNKLGEDIHFVEWHSKYFFCADGERMENDG